MSRFLLSSIGSRGDIQPYADLGRALKERGHQVAVATDELHRELVESRGLTCIALCSTTPEEQDRHIHRIVAEPDITKRATIAINEYLVPRAVKMGAGMIDLNKREHFDGVIVSDGALTYSSKAFESRISMIVVHHCPPIPATQDKWYRYYQDLAFPKILAMSPAILQPPAWLDDWWIATGFFAPAPTNTPLPIEVERFLASGARPVFVTLGSMSGVDGRHLGDMIVDALGPKGRAIIQRGASGIQPSSVPPSVLMVGEMDYGALFPRVSCVVLHGGSGTTAAVARAGVPAIFLPHLPDQLVWGDRLASLGAAAVLATETLTAAQLAQCFDRATKDADMIRAARELGARVTADGDGVSKACDAIEAQCRDFSGHQRGWAHRSPHVI